MFGRPQTAPQTEQTPFTPRSAYGISKLASYHIVRNYRDDFGMYCAVGILYNHESPRRPREFVTRKITAAAAEIKAGLRQTVEVGDLDAKRDWGFAPDYVKAMRAIIRLPEPSDYVVSTGVLHSVRDICQVAFSHLGLDWNNHVRVNPAYGRIETQVPLLGCSDKIHRETGWQPVTSFEMMIRLMVDADFERVSHMAS
jgi:GDPmannose 4,6-dehydratase